MPAIAKKIDSPVFPGEQGGPHVNVFAALALTFKLAQTGQFKKLQEQTIKNASPGRSVPGKRTASRLVGRTAIWSTWIQRRSSHLSVGLSGDQASAF